MSDAVKRYGISSWDRCELEEQAEGPFVQASDYDAAKTKITQLESEIERLKAHPQSHELTCQICDAELYTGNHTAAAEFRERHRDCGKALRKAIEKVREDINWILNSRQFFNPDVFDYLSDALGDKENQEGE